MWDALSFVLSDRHGNASMQGGMIVASFLFVGVLKIIPSIIKGGPDV
jgi:hypothetical protein